MDDRAPSREQLMDEVQSLRDRLAAGDRAAVSESMAQRIVRSAPAAVIALDGQMRVTFWSPAAEQLFGWREHEVLGRPIPLVLPEDVELFHAVFQQYLQGLREVDRLVRCRTRGDELADVYVSAGPMHNAQGRCTGVVILLRPLQSQAEAAPAPPVVEADLRQLIDAAAEGVWMLDAALRTTFVNGRMAAMLGHTAQQMLGQPIERYLIAEERAAALEQIRDRPRDEAAGRAVRFRAQGERIVQTSLKAIPVPDAAGQSAGVLLLVVEPTAQDQVQQMLEERVRQRTAPLSEANRRLQDQIAVRQKVEEALAESEARFRLIAEHASDMICRHDAQGRCLYASPSSERLLGYRPEELLACRPGTLVHPVDLPRVRANLHDASANVEPVTAVYRVRHKAGHYVWLETNATRIFDAETHQLLEIHSASRDVTARMSMESHLRLLQSVIEQMEEMVLITESNLDLPGPQIVYVNPAFTRVTGYEPKEVLGRTPRMLQGPRTSREVLDRLRRRLSQGKSFHGETYNYRKDGSEFILNWHIIPLRDGSGNITHWVSIQRDVTAQRAAEALSQRRQAELAHVGRLHTMGEMASGLAHELNQPLAAIAIYAQGSLRRLREGRAEPEDLDEALLRISGQATRANEIIRRLRDFMRKREPQRAAHAPNQLVRDVVALMEPELRSHTVRVELRLNDTVPQVLVDGIQIEQVILNLARNAIEAMDANAPEERVLMLATEQVDSQVRITIRDYGKGMSTEELDRIFEPFFTTKSQGMGMGLNISQSIVEDHGGQLHAQPNPDRGMSFHLTLPAGGEQDPQAAQTSPTDA